MNSVRNEFLDRSDEIENYYRLMTIMNDNPSLTLSDGRAFRSDIKLTATLKSGAILLLYNLVESTVKNCLEELHEVISSENIEYSELTHKLQRIWLSCYHGALKEKNITDDIMLTHIHSFINVFILHDKFTLSYNDLIKFSGSQFSGNLDDKSLKAVSDKYGIEFTEQCSELGSVRKMRNQLAHGELSFQECCNQHSIQYMIVLKDRTISLLDKFIASVESFITNKRYKSNP